MSAVYPGPGGLFLDGPGWGAVVSGVSILARDDGPFASLMK